MLHLLFCAVVLDVLDRRGRVLLLITETDAEQTAEESQAENTRLLDTMAELAAWLFDGDCDADEVFNDFVSGEEAGEAIGQ